MNPLYRRYNARAIIDADGFCASPGALLIRFDPERAPIATVLAAGPPAQVEQHPNNDGAPVIDRPDAVLLPGLVNAHTHLDLTHIGPQSHNPGDGFVAWVDRVRAGRYDDPAAIADSVRQGIDLLLAGGTVAVGDIAGAPGGAPSLVPWQVLRESQLFGVSFIEFFAIGTREETSLDQIDTVMRHALTERSDADRARLGIQPHAPNTVGPRAIAWASRLAHEHALPIATHLAETEEERRFIHDAQGPQRDFLERMGVWDDTILEFAGRGRHPIEHLLSALEPPAIPIIAAHVNDASDRALDDLAASGATVAYCPRASTYFGAPEVFGPHRYMEMLRRGIPVALGTDSIINLPTFAASADAGGISILDEMRTLHIRDGVPGATLLRMGTTHGARALGLDPNWMTFASSPLLGLIAIGVDGVPESTEPLEAALSGSEPPELLFSGTNYC